MTTGTDDILRGRGLGSLVGSAPSRSLANRQCDAAGCTTILSVYNPGRRCWIHEPMQRHLLFPGGPRSRRELRESA